jgi:hypothetical protein
LLSFMRFILPLLILACDPEDVGVRLPQGGADAVQATDLRRDLWTFTDPRIGGRAPGSSGARRVAAAVEKRFVQAHLSPAFGEIFRHDLGSNRGEMICGLRSGGGGGAVAVVALDPGIGVLSAVPIAGLMGVVKASDGPDERTHSTIFCLLPESGGLDGYVAHPPHPLDATSKVVILGSLTGEALQVAPGPGISGIQSEVWHTGPIAPALGDDMGRVDFEALATQVRGVHLRLSETKPSQP